MKLDLMVKNRICLNFESYFLCKIAKQNVTSFEFSLSQIFEGIYFDVSMGPHPGTRQTL